MEAPGPRTVPKLGKLPSLGLKDGVTPNESRVAGFGRLFFWLKRGGSLFPLGAISYFALLIGRVGGALPWALLANHHPLSLGGPCSRAPLLDFSTFSPSFLRLILFDIATK